AFALKAVGGRTTKSESNFFSSVGRIQAGTVGKPKVMLLGSSITGRLPDRANGFEGFANMGCDGGSAVDALRAIDSGILPIAPTLVIEANTLSLALDPMSSEVGAAMRSPWFKLGMRYPALSAYARPAAFAYSILLSRKIGEYGNPESEDDLKVTSKPRAILSAPQSSVSTEQKALIEELVPLLDRLEARGCKLVFIWLPPARSGNSPPPTWIRQLLAESHSLWWDLGNEALPELVTLTDSVHMSAPSAARTVISLRKGLLELESAR
ncbi:MAG: hypothetical protein NWS16_07725, partial [Akkermansiaceae bacterium]|nr:hypothetical protein [Akkermansiaceae bacterium]